MRGDGRDEGEAQPRLAHVVVAAGTPEEWSTFGCDEWSERLDALALGATSGGASWVTLVPHHGPDLAIEALTAMCGVLESVGAVPSRLSVLSNSSRHERAASGYPTVIIDPIADGRARFAAVAEDLRRGGFDPEDLDEKALSRALLAPALAEPDLVLVLGPSDTLPTSLVWELAYSELVFLDHGWDDLHAEHLRMAVHDFAQRQRRFGGIDS